MPSKNSGVKILFTPEMCVSKKIPGLKKKKGPLDFLEKGSDNACKEKGR